MSHKFANNFEHAPRICRNINKEIPNGADCLINEFSNLETLDLIVKLKVIEKTRSLDETEMKMKLNKTPKELQEDLEKMASQCQTEDKIFIAIFNEHFRIKNETLDALQYCIAKYAADNKILRQTSEKDFREKMNLIPKSASSSGCIMNAYRRF